MYWLPQLYVVYADSVVQVMWVFLGDWVGIKFALSSNDWVFVSNNTCADTNYECQTRSA